MKPKFVNVFKIATGIFLLILNLGIWINGCIIHIERGMDTVFSLFFLVPGAFLLLGGYKNTRSIPFTKHQRWKFILNILLINYAVLYIIYIASDLIYHESIDFMSIPGIILPFLLGIFIMGFILSWKHELYAGIFFLLWYSLVLFGSFRYVEIMARGPHMHFGIVIFIHGILYIYYYFRFRSRTYRAREG
jgi:hypothetical protein